MEYAKGLYLHVPFCASKCSYCDFHSACGDDALMDSYCDALCREMENHRGQVVDSLYIGGGTPSLLGAERIAKVLEAVHKNFTLSGEATMEANPADDLYEIFKAAKQGGINRISMGVQSGIGEELKILSRRHGVYEAEKAVEDCRRAGIHNISLDLMLGIPLQTPETLHKSIEFLVGLEPKHISAYILKLEEGTPLYKSRGTLPFPDEDTTADLYLQTVKELAEKGFSQYEISNFAVEGYESQHNLKYWRCQEYVGIGPSAHGFLDGKRYFYPADTEGFIKKPQIIPDGEGGGEEERFMLGLRLTEGVDIEDFPHLKLKEKAEIFVKHGLCRLEENRLSLTSQGFLVSNEILAEFLS